MLDRIKALLEKLARLPDHSPEWLENPSVRVDLRAAVTEARFLLVQNSPELQRLQASQATRTGRWSQQDALDDRLSRLESPTSLPEVAADFKFYVVSTSVPTRENEEPVTDGESLSFEQVCRLLRVTRINAETQRRWDDALIEFRNRAWHLGDAMSFPGGWIFAVRANVNL